MIDALGGDIDPALGSVGGSEGRAGVKRNWWEAAREVIQVSKGKGIIVTSGVTNVADLRAPRDMTYQYTQRYQHQLRTTR
ncbi:hypothetical protein BC629DRAFT_48718 [Irpex lacteus]|nr:hypothetical protein BC629DRAFT_48718 [Irpex lacteus]